MVRKRTYKKHVQESDESDSDELEETISSSAETKKYSLRQRRSTNFAEDYDYDVVEEVETNAGTSGEILRPDDEDFDLDAADYIDSTETDIPEPQTSKTTPKPKSRNQVTYIPQSKCTITKYKERELEPEIPTDRQSSGDLIDFEDVIRADILVNKNRIDYDNIIEKSEIKLEKNNEPVVEEIPKKPFKLKKSNEPPKKRGRKPKQRQGEILPQQCDYDEFPENTSSEFDSTGLPINSVLGVSESLYELAERYQMEGGSISGAIYEEINQPAIPTIETAASCFLQNDDIHSLQDSETGSEAIETF